MGYEYWEILYLVTDDIVRYLVYSFMLEIKSSIVDFTFL